MTYPYVLSPAADRDTDEHFLYIARRNRDAAVRFLAATKTTFDRLASMPDLGQRQPFREGRLADLRVWQVQGFENYLIFYRLVDDGGSIEVVRVLHAARDVEAVLEDDS